MGSLGSLNPFTWFGGNRAAESSGTAQTEPGARSLAPRRGYVQVIDTRPMIDQITAMSVERTPAGVIVHATGLPPTQGFHSADLVAVRSANPGELAFEFRVSPPAQAPRIGSARSREVVAATFLSRQQVSGVRRIRVTAGRNNRTARP